MWSRLFSGVDGKDPKQKEADMADAIRGVLGKPDYMDQLRAIATAGPYTRLKGLIEGTEFAAVRAERPGDDQLSDASVVATAQKLVGILNSIANPKPKLQLMVSDSPDGPFTEFSAPDSHGYTVKDYRRIAGELAQPLRPLVPNPKLVGGVGE